MAQKLTTENSHKIVLFLVCNHQKTSTTNPPPTSRGRSHLPLYPFLPYPTLYYPVLTYGRTLRGVLPPVAASLLSFTSTASQFREASPPPLPLLWLRAQQQLDSPRHNCISYNNTPSQPHPPLLLLLFMGMGGRTCCRCGCSPVWGGWWGWCGML